MKRTLLFALALIAAGCADSIPRNVDTLVEQGDVLLDRETMRPYTGPIFELFPDDGYRTRTADPRVGVNGHTVYDYATTIDEDTRLRWVARHRLEKRDRGPGPSEPVEPIVYPVVDS